MAINHISSEEHDVRVKTTMPDSTLAHRQKTCASDMAYAWRGQQCVPV